MSESKNEEGMTFVCVASPGAKRFPKWKRGVWVDASGSIHVPAALAPVGENAAVMSAGFDGVSMMTASRHVYLPLDWFRGEYPDMAEVCDSIERGVAQALGKEGTP